MADAISPSSAPLTRRRSLVPHEHGAYGQLAMPLLTALALGTVTPAAAALSVAAVLAFLAHEPLLLLAGGRGRRALEEDGARARRALLMLGGGAALTGAAGTALAPAAARAALGVSFALAVAVGGLVLRKLEKTLVGEVIVAAALSSAGLVVALAAGVSLAVAFASWAAWILAFSSAILAVQVVLVRARTKGRRDPGRLHAVLVAGGLAATFPLCALVGVPQAAPIALAPTALLSLAVCLLRVPPRRLRELGWALIASSAATLLLLVVGLR